MEGTKGTMVNRLLLELPFMIVSAFWKPVLTASLAMIIRAIFKIAWPFLAHRDPRLQFVLCFWMILGSVFDYASRFFNARHATTPSILMAPRVVQGHSTPVRKTPTDMAIEVAAEFYEDSISPKTKNAMQSVVDNVRVI